MSKDSLPWGQFCPAFDSLLANAVCSLDETTAVSADSFLRKKKNWKREISYVFSYKKCLENDNKTASLKAAHATLIYDIGTEQKTIITATTLTDRYIKYNI